MDVDSHLSPGMHGGKSVNLENIFEDLVKLVDQPWEFSRLHGESGVRHEGVDQLPIRRPNKDTRQENESSEETDHRDIEKRKRSSISSYRDSQ